MRSHGVVAIQFLTVLNLFLGGKNDISKNTLTELYRDLFLQGLNEKGTSVKLNLDVISKLVSEINMQLQKSIYANSRRDQKIKFQNVQKLKDKFECFKDDFGDENEKIEHEVVDTILKNKDIPIEIEEELKIRTVNARKKTEEDKKRCARHFRYC